MKKKLFPKKRMPLQFSKPLAMVGCMVLCAFSACHQDNLWTNLEHDNVPPEPVSHVVVEPLAGAARIRYDLPKGHSLDVLYVQADYEIRPGVKQQTSTSFYDNELTVEGFGDTAVHAVSLVTVDRSGNRSEPVTVEFKPLKPPVYSVFDSLSYAEDFGGIRIHFINEARANLMIGVMIKDSTGAWTTYDKEYSGLPEAEFAVRNLPSVPTVFGVYVRDRWQNYSDTLIQEMTPLFEEELDKSLFKELKLPGDGTSTWSLSGLWDKVPGSHSGIHSNESNGVPAHYQFALGVKAKISRFKVWQIFDGREYSSNNIKAFELWGTNETPAADGSFDGWTLLGSFEVKKPSGLPSGQLSNDDKATAAAGDEFTMPFTAPPTSYIRLNVLSTFSTPPNSKNGGIWLTEVSFWGQKE